MIIAFHPDTINLEDNTKYAQMFVRLIEDNPDTFFVLVLPNLDAGNKDIIKVTVLSTFANLEQIYHLNM